MICRIRHISLLALPIAVAACNGSEPEEGPAPEAENYAATSQALTALTWKSRPDATLSGVGVSLVDGRTYRIKNDLGACAARSGVFDTAGQEQIAAATCDANADVAGKQQWAIYQVTPGVYDVCAPETLRRQSQYHCPSWWNLGDNANGPICGQAGWRYGPLYTYSAMCVAYQGYLTGEQRYVMKRTYLAYQPWDFVKRVTSSNYTTYDNMDQFGGIKSSMGLVTWDPVGRYIGESGRRWTVSGGLVVPGKLSGNPDQKWGFYD